MKDNKVMAIIWFAAFFVILGATIAVFAAYFCYGLAIRSWVPELIFGDVFSFLVALCFLIK